MQHNNGGIYALLDLAAGHIVGVLQIFRHEAAAVRFFSDLANMEQSMVRQHPEDFNLIRLGFLTLDNTLAPEYSVVITGRAWAAAQTDHTPKLVREVNNA